MDQLAQQEKIKYEKMWDTSPYRKESPGAFSYPFFLSLTQSKRCKGDRLIDFGCGEGLSARMCLENDLDADLVDIASNSLGHDAVALMRLFPDRIKFQMAPLWDLPDSLLFADWVYCADVLEHIPEEKIDKTLEGISLRTIKGGFIQICTAEDHMGALIGEKLHLTVHPEPWWRSKIGKYWKIQEEISLVKDQLHAFYVQEPISFASDLK